MSQRVEVRSFEAVESFRSAVVRFIETANAALASAEADIARTLNWLDTEQVPHWKSQLKKSADALEKAKAAYREKRFYKDASGARHSAIDELKVLRKVEAKRAEIEKRAKATRRNLRELQRDITMYHAGAHQLRNMVNGILPVAVEELRRVVMQLEAYVQAAPERVVERGQEMSRGEMALTAPPTDDEAALEKLIEALRRRTPTAKARAAAQRADFIPPLPEVANAAVTDLTERLAGKPPGKYDVLTTTLAEGEAGGDVYLERVEPTSAGDSGWHLGSAGADDEGGACVTMTIGRIAAQQAKLGRLLGLPVGSLLICREGRLEVVVDGLGRILWRRPQSNQSLKEA